MWNLDSAVNWIQNAKELKLNCQFGLIGEVLERSVSNTTLNVLVVPLNFRTVHDAAYLGSFHIAMERQLGIELLYKSSIAPGFVFVGNLPDGRHISFHLMF